MPTIIDSPTAMALAAPLGGCVYQEPDPSWPRFDPAIHLPEEHATAFATQTLPQTMMRPDYYANFAYKNQPPLGSCTACMTTAHMQDAAFVQKGVVRELSELFNYHEADPSPTRVDTGNSIYGALSLAQRIGVCLESLWPYSITQGTGDDGLTGLRTPTSPEAKADAFKQKIGTLLYVGEGGEPGMGDKMRAIIAAKGGVSTGHGAHAFYINEYFDGNWFQGPNSYGPHGQNGDAPDGKITVLSTDSLFNIWTIVSVDYDSAAAPQGVNMTAIVKGRTDWAALTGEPVTKAVQDMLVADAMALVLVPADTGYDPKDCYPFVAQGAGQTPPGFDFGLSRQPEHRWTLPQGSTLCLDTQGSGVALYTRCAEDGRIPLKNVDGSINPTSSGANFAAEVARLDAILNGSVTPPPVVPPADVVYLSAGAPLTDGAGLVWTYGEFVSTRFGSQLRCNGRGLATSPEVALVGGKIKRREGSNWFVFSGRDAFDNTWTATTAP